MIFVPFELEQVELEILIPGIPLRMIFVPFEL